MSIMYRIKTAPQINRHAIGQFLPYLFGALHRVPLIPYRTGAQASMRFTITAGSSGGVIYVDDVEALEDFPATGTIQIDGERLDYTGRDLGNAAFTGVTHGAMGTTPTDH